MTLTDFFSRMTLSRKDAEVIFDRDEPVGQPTDLVMPRHRWFRRKNAADKRTEHAARNSSSHS